MVVKLSWEYGKTNNNGYPLTKALNNIMSVPLYLIQTYFNRLVFET